MQTKLLPAASSDRQRLENLLEKYNYGFSQYDTTHFGADGLFGYEWLPTYFEGRDDRAAYLIYAEESLAGFALINRIAECDRPLDWAVAEFFVAYPFRRNGVGSAAMEQVFVRHSGRWQIKYHSKNLPSAAFWNGIARHYPAGSVETLFGRRITRMAHLQPYSAFPFPQRLKAAASGFWIPAPAGARLMRTEPSVSPAGAAIWIPACPAPLRFALRMHSNLRPQGFVGSAIFFPC